MKTNLPSPWRRGYLRTALAMLTLCLAASGAIAQTIANKTFKVDIDKNVVYGVAATANTDDGYMDLTLDVYAPRGAQGLRPAIIITHGGKFTFLSKEQRHHADLAQFFARRGFVAFSIDYRQVKDAPPAPEPYASRKLSAAQYAAVMDTKAAVRWIRANAAVFSVDKNSIVGLGSSAGGAIMYGMALTDPTDFAVASNDDPTYAINHGEESAALQACAAFWGNPSFYADEVDADDTPLLMVHGIHDPHRLETPFEEVARLQQALEEAGTPHEHYFLDRRGHTHWGAKVDGLGLGNLALDFFLRQLAQ